MNKPSLGPIRKVTQIDAGGKAPIPIKQIVVPKAPLPVEEPVIPREAETSKPSNTAAKIPGIKLTNDGIGMAMFYNFMFGQQGYYLPNHLMHLCWALADKRITKLLVIVGPGSGKALHPDTPILTPMSWRRIGSLIPGDRVVCPDGKNYATVLAVQSQVPARLFKLTFDDGRQILAHENHLWLAHHKKLRRERRGETGENGLLWETCTTGEIAKRLVSDNQLRWYVPLIEPFQAPVRDLPFPPYTLGVVLGDGCIQEFGGPSITNPDIEIRREVEKEIEGLDLAITTRSSNSSGCPVWGIVGAAQAMKLLGLNGKRSWEKFIPTIYKEASEKQRLAVLQGLMDTDGSCSSSATFSTTSYQLALDVQELVWSLGGMAKISSRQTHFTYKGEKKPGRKSYRLNLRLRDSSEVFRLAKKKNKGIKGQYSDTLKLRILSIEREETVSSSICISLDSPDGLYIAKDFVVTHNSSIISICYPAFAIGQDSTTTILGVSAGESLMQGFVTATGSWIESAPMWKLLFPTIVPDKSKGWSTERGLFVIGHPAGNPDASYFAAGLTSKALTGKHARLIIGDDLHDRENSSSIEACLKVREFFYRQLIGRADPRGARFIFAGRRWHQEDLYGHLKSTGEWVVMELPALREGSTNLYWDVSIPDGLECVFNDPTFKDQLNNPMALAGLAGSVGIDAEKYINSPLVPD